MTWGASIRIFLVDGTSEGLRFVEKSNWTGQAIVVSRSGYPDVRGRSEFGSSGVYVLMGTNNDGSVPTLYVGEGDNVRVRLDQHVKSKDFWTQAIVFRSKDRTLNKAHIRYLESRLVELAIAASIWSVDNATTPQLPTLSEAERADTESFLADMLLIYPLLGVDAFEIPKPEAGGGRLLHLSGPGALGQGYDRPEGFLVLKGSKGRPFEADALPAHVRALREELIHKEVLVPIGDSLELAKDFVFGSPSLAAALLLGRSANGRTEWKDESGLTLKEIQDSAVGM